MQDSCIRNASISKLLSLQPKMRICHYFDFIVPKTVEEGAQELTAPTFLKPLEEMSVRETEHVVLECKIAGQPLPEIRWYKVRMTLANIFALFSKL